jgi:hypothetical protein
MRMVLLIGCVLSVSACASAPGAGSGLGPGSRVTTQTINTGAGGGTMGMTTVNDANAVGVVVNGSVDATWSALQSVYASLEIPLTFREEAKKTLGNSSFRTRRRVGSVPMIRVVDCGGETGMPNAETYDVTLDVSSLVQPDVAGKSKLQTLVQGTARRSASGGTNDVRCNSLGGLEKKISDMVSAILAGK